MACPNYRVKYEMSHRARSKSLTLPHEDWKKLRSPIKGKIILRSLTEILRAPRVQMNVTLPHRYRINITHSYKDEIYYVEDKKI